MDVCIGVDRRRRASEFGEMLQRPSTPDVDFRVDLVVTVWKFDESYFLKK